MKLRAIIAPIIIAIGLITTSCEKLSSPELNQGTTPPGEVFTNNIMNNVYFSAFPEIAFYEVVSETKIVKYDYEGNSTLIEYTPEYDTETGLIKSGYITDNEEKMTFTVNEYQMYINTADGETIYFVESIYDLPENQSGFEAFDGSCWIDKGQSNVYLFTDSIITSHGNPIASQWNYFVSGKILYLFGKPTLDENSKAYYPEYSESLVINSSYLYDTSTKDKYHIITSSTITDDFSLIGDWEISGPDGKFSHIEFISILEEGTENIIQKAKKHYSNKELGYEEYFWTWTSNIVYLTDSSGNTTETTIVNNSTIIDADTGNIFKR